MQLSQLVGYLDDYLRVRDVPDASEALNGLQVGGRAEVTRVAAAVDLCEATVRLAAERGADFLIVHHGLFWGGLRPLTGPQLRRVAGLLKHDIALYGAHLPLDLHSDVGNNPVLARELGVTIKGEFGESRGVAIGVWGELAVSRAELEQRLADARRAAQGAGLRPRDDATRGDRDGRRGRDDRAGSGGRARHLHHRRRPAPQLLRCRGARPQRLAGRPLRD